MNRLTLCALLIGLPFAAFSNPDAASNGTTIKKSLSTKSKNKTLNLVIDVRNNNDARSNNSTNIGMQQIAKQPTTTTEPTILNKLSELWADNIKIKKQLEHGSDFLSANKWYLLAGGLACSYGLLAYTIITGNYYLGDSTLWSSWHQELPMDQLLAIPQQQLTQDLIREIQRRYTDSTSIADIVKPLGIFMVKIDEEEETIKWHQTVYSWLSFGRLHKLVPVSQQRFSKICERLQRIAYYKNLFKSWAADYQLQQADRFWYRCPEIEYPGIEEMSQLLQIEMRLQTLNYWLKQAKRAVPTPH